MYRKIKALLIVFSFATILVYNPVSAHANPYPTEHICAFSFDRDQLYYSSTADHHWYYHSGKYLQCDIVGYHYEKIGKCSCGKEKTLGYYMKTVHMQCGH